LNGNYWNKQLNYILIATLLLFSETFLAAQLILTFFLLPYQLNLVIILTSYKKYKTLYKIWGNMFHKMEIKPNDLRANHLVCFPESKRQIFDFTSIINNVWKYKNKNKRYHRKFWAQVKIIDRKTWAGSGPGKNNLS